MTVVASDVFPLIHALLTRSGLKKAAAALAKEAKLQPKAFESQHDLVEVFNFYMKQHNGTTSKGDAVPILEEGAVKKVQKKKKKENSIEAEDEMQVVVRKGPVSSSKKEKVLVHGEKKSLKKGAEKKGLKKADAGKEEVESSSSDSSDEEVEEPKMATSKKAGADKVKTKEEDSSDSDDKVQSKTLKRKLEASAAAKNVKKAKRDADSSSDDSSSSDDDSSDSSDSSDDEEARTKETARRDEAAKAALEWQPKKMEKVATTAKSAGIPFQRVDGEFWSQKIVNDTLRDNSYEGTFGTDGVGVKANTKLLKTRGKDFTKGKNKLKRSTYMCGAISMASNSFKFDE